jgi:uncharacterized protein (DUF1501 family)
MRRRRFIQMLSATLAAATGTSGRSLAANDARRLVVFYNRGGWDPSYVFDPHFGQDSVDGDSLSTPSSINGINFADAESRPSVRGLFERFGEKIAVVNGLRVPTISHTMGVRLLMTGSRAGEAPDITSLVASNIGQDLSLPHLVLSGPRYPGTISGTMVPMSFTMAGAANGELPVGWSVEDDHQAALDQYLSEQYMGLQPTERLNQDLAMAWQRRLSLRENFGLTVEHDSSISQQINNIVTSFSEGLSCCATIQSEMPEFADWDSHSNNYFNQNAAYESSFGQLHQLIEALEEASLLSTTTVMVVSEMGRTPLENSLGGKDHWPYTSAMIIGGGVDGGRVLGATDENLLGITVDFASGQPSSSGAEVDISNLHAGLLLSMGIDSELYFPGMSPFLAPFST